MKKNYITKKLKEKTSAGFHEGNGILWVSLIILLSSHQAEGLPESVNPPKPTSAIEGKVF